MDFRFNEELYKSLPRNTKTGRVWRKSVESIYLIFKYYNIKVKFDPHKNREKSYSLVFDNRNIEDAKRNSFVNACYQMYGLEPIEDKEMGHHLSELYRRKSDIRYAEVEPPARRVYKPKGGQRRKYISDTKSFPNLEAGKKYTVLVYSTNGGIEKRCRNLIFEKMDDYSLYFRHAKGGYIDSFARHNRLTRLKEEA